jgi:glycosyltransferase involved in cell wall biosynthesis
MKFSIITPSNKTTYLNDLYQSIKAQTYTNWEWIVWLNQGASSSDLPNEIASDTRVRYFVSDSPNSSVGFHKKCAFFQGEGDVLVEADHDDFLLPTCLEELAQAFKDPTIGFAYSDTLQYHTRGEFKPYNSFYGWEHDYHDWNGLSLARMRSFPPSSRSLAFIWYAPDHIRAWRTDVYSKLGGHDPELSICDDHDLIIRTYLETRMAFINKPLYVYRITGENTWLARNQAIQTETVRLFHKYAHALAERDAQLQGLLKVDLGGGIDPRSGYLTMDIDGGADILCDLNDGIPLEDNSVGVINASHVIEHLKDPIKTMREIHRVLVDGGWAFIQVPSTDGRGAWQDPTHVSFWNKHSFWYYTRADKARYIRNSTIRFQEFRNEDTTWDDGVVVTDCWLTAVKSDARRPHPVTI